MRSVAKKIFILFGCITLIILSVIPVTANANREEYASCMATNGDETFCRQYLTTQEQTSTGVKPIDTSLTGIGDAILSATGLSQAANSILYILMTLAAGILALAGLFLDFILNISVVELSERLVKITSINTTWGYIRDLANMSFIFILLYEGIRMILGLESSEIKKVIVNVIVAAVLVNFSLFFTKVVIDASNIITLGFYNAILRSSSTATGLSGILMNALRLGDLYGGVGAVIGTIFSGSLGTVVLVGNTVFLFIATFVLLVISVMFVIRYLSFILLLIMSPIAFVSMAIPGLDSLKDKYVKTLTGQALFAPVFMLLTFIMLKLASDTNFLSASTSQTSWFAIIQGKNDNQIISTIVDYMLLIGLLLYSLILSKQVATKGGFVTNGMINKGTSWVGGAMFGGAALAGRQTIGSYADKVAKDEDLQKRADKGDVFAKATLWGAKKTASGSFDARRSTVGEKAASFMGVDMGTGVPWKSDAGKGGYAGVKAAKKKEAEGKLDEITKRYKDKEDWSKLAEVFNERSADDQKYMYKSLSAKERIGLEMALDQKLGGAKGKILRNTLKSKKEEEEKTEEEAIKYFSKNKDWTGLVAYFNPQNNQSTSTADQQFIYKTLSARDRVAFGKALGNATLLKDLNDKLSPEEQDKTKEMQKKVERQERDEQHVADIEALVAGIPTINPATNQPYTYDELFSKTFSTKNARNLSEAALQNPEVVKRLKAEHLKDIRENADISDAVKQEIVRVINGSTAYSNQQKHKNELQKNIDYWI